MMFETAAERQRDLELTFEPSTLIDVASGKRWTIHIDPLQQDRAWKTATGQVLAIEHMTDRHLTNTVRFLRRRAAALHARAVWQMVEDATGPLGPGGDAACDAFDDELDELEAADPAEWLDSTPLVRGMLAELVRRHEPWGVAA